VGEISADSRDSDGTTFRDYGTKKTDIIFVTTHLPTKN
jgi:hypothetical protein